MNRIYFHWIPIYNSEFNVENFLLLLEMKVLFIRMQLKHCQVKNVMLPFVIEAHYAILLYLYKSFLLRSLMFPLNIK